MLKKIILIVITLSIFSCSKEQIPKIEKETDDLTKKIFIHIKDFPFIKDTVKFIKDLKNTFNFIDDSLDFKKEVEKINAYKIVKIFGSDKNFIFIEYDYLDGCCATYPWKIQLILTSDGKLKKTLYAKRYEFVEIFNNENPYLLILNSTYRGNGGHELYKISADTLENVYEGYINYDVKTLDCYDDNKVYEPYELRFNIKDYNNDGYNDISFSGFIVYVQGISDDGFWYDVLVTESGKKIRYSEKNPFKKTPIEFIFIYDKKTGHFKAKEDYRKKYKLYN